ncbi:MAG: cation-translocating P-type ATPase [bacterium]|nr:cation-translocating P-type ATPase [bacterium]
MSWYKKDLEEVFKELGSSEKGLSSSEVQKRLTKYGRNVFAKKKKISWMHILLQQFIDPLVFVLFFAILISFFIQHFIDAFIILGILIFNAIFVFFQEYKAEKALDLLQKLRQYKTRVVRAGKDVLVDSEELVMGDIIYLEEGDRIPADCRLLEIIDLEVDEASLTGESKAVKKTLDVFKKELVLGDQKNMLFAGTTLVRGKGTAIIVAIGQDTELGKIAKELDSIEKEATPLQKKLKEVGRLLTIIVVVLSVLVFLLGVFKGFAVYEMFLIAVSLAVASVPEGLPAVVTITLALGLQRLLKRKALIRKLRSVETLGSVTVICSDKTGTITKNEMTVTKVYADDKEYTVSGSGYSLHGEILLNGKKAGQDIEELLLIATTCNNATLDIGDPTERALQVLAAKGKIIGKKRVSEVPFSSETKFMSVTDREGRVYMKGAVEVVLHKCSHIFVHGKLKKLEKKDIDLILKKNEVFSKGALRVLAFASGKGKDMTFVGLVGMIDPAREEVKDAIALCTKAGIRSVMITGDHGLTAQAVAKQVGIEGEVLTGVELDKISDSELRNIVKKISIYARVSSLHKQRILKALQKNGEVVAMTGDGVNDAPALKQADVGVAMNLKGTEVSKDVSDLILMDDNFATIVAAVEEGRTIYANIKKFVKYLLAANFGEVMIVILSLFFQLPLPLLPLQILWLNLVTDSFPALALGIDPADPKVMVRKPRDPQESFFTGIRSFMFFSTLFSVISVLGIFLWYLQFGDLEKARTVAFTTLVIFELILVFAARSEDVSYFKLKRNWYLFGAVLFSFALHLFLLYGPFAEYFSVVALDISDWILIVLPTFLFAFVFFELKKWVKNLFKH